MRISPNTLPPDEAELIELYRDIKNKKTVRQINRQEWVKSRRRKDWREYLDASTSLDLSLNRLDMFVGIE